jgi:hypothetical protein
MTATGWTATTEPAKHVDSPLAKIVAKMDVDDTGTKRMQVIYDGGRVPEHFPMAEDLNEISAMPAVAHS